MSQPLGKAAIIGAGSSGIVACKVLKQHGVPFDCFEAGDRVGGNWVYENANGMSSAYRSLHINTSRPKMQYSDFPMPAEYPEFPHHAQIAAYFDHYAEHFGLKPHIRFRTRVLQCEPVNGGGWEITSDDGQTGRYSALLVANGHHWSRRWPEPAFPGEFRGQVMHSHDYKTPEGFDDKNVVVVGFGNSAIDIAVELSRVARRTMLSVRRGFHVIPKYILGRPLDQSVIPTWFPLRLQVAILKMALRLQQGDVTQYGLPKPNHELLHAHPTVSSDLLSRLAHGDIAVRPDIKLLDGGHVEFADGSREAADVLIYCTGYRVDFPFFRPDLISAPNNDLPLFCRVFHPQYRDLFFIGLLQPLGAIMPLAELQSEWIADYLTGEYALPALGDMQNAIRRERETMLRRYGNTPRHTMQVDFAPYVRMVNRERKLGAGRARKSPESPRKVLSAQAAG
ncbi:MAG TPA: NAD(P)-binding domain-containing protein [Candidatus Limnocylindrales bacterium]|nr:NAD(P)-binding domain-containing protein [Candidatus Limnocylindrales bacterium]